MERTPPKLSHGRDAASTRVYTTLAWLLSFLFFLRVLGQAIQRWLPQPYLPAFDDFQGSNLPYWALLLSQLAILGLMTYFSWGVQRRSLVPSRRTGVTLAWLGGMYMAVALGRFAIGQLIAKAPAWFTAWIPAAFHVVLAAYVLTFAAYHLAQSCVRDKRREHHD